MNNELLFLNEKHTYTFIEQTKTKPQKTPEFHSKKQMVSFSFNPPINLAEESKWLLAVTSFEATNSVFNITDENKSFLITTPGHWNSKDGEEFNNKLIIILDLRSENDIELQIK